MKPPEKSGPAGKQGQNETLTTVGNPNEGPNPSQLYPSLESRGKPGKNRPYCWQEKAVRRQIREMFDATGNVASALGVYDALTEIASDEQCDTFQTTHDHIGRIAGCSSRTVRGILPLFEKLRILKITENFHSGMRGPSTYTLLARQRTFSESLPISEESSEKSLKNTRKEKSTPFCKAKMARDWRNFYSERELFVIDLYHEMCVPEGWLPITQDSKELHNALALYSSGADHICWRVKFHEAVREREEGHARYNAPKGNKLLRILWNI